jgi:hypothetical protein
MTRKTSTLKRGTQKMAKLVKVPEHIDVQRITIPPASEVNAAFMKVGDMIQQRHREAFKRLADR